MGIDALLLDSITDADDRARGRIVVSGSHGGLYPAALASKWGLRAVLFNDAGIGFEGAGVAGVLALADIGMAAAAMDCHSCHIGSARDGVDRGRVSVVNAAAAELGVTEGAAVGAVLQLLAEAPPPRGELPAYTEARREVTLDGSGKSAWLVDSASLVRPDDAGQIVVTGSHGGLVGGDPARALKADARIAAFNDAGVGLDGIGISRLPALDHRGVAAVCVDCRTARIGDAASMLEGGLISHANEKARGLGARAGLLLKAWLAGV